MATLTQLKEEQKKRRRLHIAISLPVMLIPLFISMIAILNPPLIYNLVHKNRIEKGTSPIVLGLDFKGGARVVYQASASRLRGQKNTDKLLEKSKDILIHRLSSFGNFEPTVRVAREEQQIIVELPGVSDLENISEMVGETGNLEFLVLKKGIDPAQWLFQEINDSIVKEIILTKEDIKKVEAVRTPVARVDLELLNSESERVNKSFARNAGNKVLITLNGFAVRVIIISKDFSGTQGNIHSISNTDGSSLSAKEMESYLTIFNWETLPINLRKVSSSRISSYISETQLTSAMVGLLIGILLIFIFLLVFYGTYLGVVGCIAFTYCVVVIIGVFNITGLVLNLPGLAGLILTAGVSVDSFILIFEEVKDTIRKRMDTGNKYPFDEQTIWNSITKITRHLWTLRITTLIGCFVLLFFSGPIKGFAITSIIGLTVSIIVSSKWIIGGLMIMMDQTGRNVNQTTYGIPVFEYGAFVDLFKNLLTKKYVIGIFSSILVVLSIGIIGVKGFNLNNDFIPGVESVLDGRNIQDIEDFESQVLYHLDKKNVKIFSLQEIERQENDSYSILLKTEDVEKNVIPNLVDYLKSKNFDIVQVLSQTTSSIVNKEMFITWILAILLSLLAIFLYCSLPFSRVHVSGFYFLPIITALVAVVHDVIIVLGVLSLFDIEVSIPVFSALVSLTGYSVSDSLILIYRINDILKEDPKISKSELVDQAMMKVKTRTMNTMIVTLISIMPALFIDIGFIKPFALTVFISLIVGMYSSFFIVSPILDRAFKHQRERKAGQTVNTRI